MASDDLAPNPSSSQDIPTTADGDSSPQRVGGAQNAGSEATPSSNDFAADAQDGVEMEGPGPVGVDLGHGDEEQEEEDIDDYREGLEDFVVESDEEDDDDIDDFEDPIDDDIDDVGDEEEEEEEDPEETGEFNKPKDGETLIGCKHYRRRCALVCPTCQKAYTCRFCHDEAEFKHELDRKAVMNVKCLECGLIQNVQRTCQGCHIDFALYFCPTCRLYDDVDKKQYHCDGCKICRIGGRENFFHCQICDMCLANDMRDNHKCIEKMSRSNCPVCLEDLHTSRKSCRVPKCGHMLHFKCMQQLLRTGNYACPTCSVSMVDMSTVWARLDHEVSVTPMPAEYRDFKVQILCRDCHKESRSPFHILGQKCSHCSSYNTCRTAEKGEAATLLDNESELEAREQQQADAEDAAAAVVREVGLEARIGGEDDLDDETGHDPELQRIRSVIDSLTAHRRRDSRHSEGAVGGIERTSLDDDPGEGSSGSSGGASSSGVNSGSGASARSNIPGRAPIYVDYEDDDDLD